jgi:ubiquinone biosynthesis protein COQ9
MPRPADPTRLALLRAALSLRALRGLVRGGLRPAARDAHLTLAEARAAAPRGALDLLVEWHREADRAVVAALQGASPDMRVRERVAFALKARARAMGDREAARRGAALLALPGHVLLAARLPWDTADAAWTAMGDRSRDGNWWSKRAVLAAVQASVALFALGDASEDGADTDAFIDRRVDDVMAFERWKARAGANPLLRPLAAPLGRLMAAIPAPARPADLPGAWSD